MKQTIPKVIHYCWFGGKPLPELAQRCIASWKKYCPDYEIIRWDESNFDFNYNDYVREAYEAKKWAFVSDILRLYVLVEHGGIYMDTDVELLKPLDNLLEFEALTGFECDEFAITGLMASIKGHKMFREMLDDYNGEHFINEDGSLNMKTNTARATELLLRHGLILNNTMQTVNGMTFFPNDYFCPKNFATSEVHLTRNTYAIHHFNGSWLPEEVRCQRRVHATLSQYLPGCMSIRLAIIYRVLKFRGISFVLHKILARAFRLNRKG